MNKLSSLYGGEQQAEAERTRRGHENEVRRPWPQDERRHRECKHPPPGCREYATATRSKPTAAPSGINQDGERQNQEEIVVSVEWRGEACRE